MHHVLQIQEILSNIFGHCLALNRHDTERKAVADLAALARTCRSFKEPALDVLWSVLDDLSPLPRCLPEISYQTVAEHGLIGSRMHGFSRPLEQAELGILQSYTRRVWSISWDVKAGLDWKSVRNLNIPIDDPLFPNLRAMNCNYGKEVDLLFCLPLPSLTCLFIGFDGVRDWHTFRDPLESIANFSPNIKKLYITNVPLRLESTLSRVVSSYVTRWPNLTQLDCGDLVLGVDALVHLSHVCPLEKLSCVLAALPGQNIISDMSFPFPRLHTLEMKSRLLSSISDLLSRTELPILASITVRVQTSPSKQDLSVFHTSIQACATGNTINEWKLIQNFDFDLPPNEPRGTGVPLLDLEDLRPAIAFGNIRHVELDLEWNIGLTDDELLTLGLAWLQLQKIFINEEWGWNTSSGITPNGLARLIRVCRSLNSVALFIDTRRHVGSCSSRTYECYQVLPYKFYINVVDSVIDEETVSTMATFLAGIVPHFEFILDAWEGGTTMARLGQDVYVDRWRAVHGQGNKALFSNYTRFSYFRRLSESPIGLEEVWVTREVAQW